jgi:hypothetical protein
MRLEFGNRNRLKPSLGNSIRYADQHPQSPPRSRRLRTWHPVLQCRALPRTSARGRQSADCLARLEPAIAIEAVMDAAIDA